MSTGQLSKTLLKNNSRIITGLNNSLYQDDSILLCNTSTDAVSLNLLPIPTDYWNTNQKIYIVDNSNNAATNNITINAPIGFTIDGLSSLVISTNGGGVYIRVLSNTAYISANGSGSGGAGGHVIQENGTNKTQRLNLNFLNATITDNPSNTSTDVWINGAGVISLTNAAMLALIAANTVIEGQKYRITDVINCDTANGDFGIIITGTRNNGITVEGEGLFLNADYQAVGNYSAVTGAGTNLGIWVKETHAVNVNDFCVYNNLNWRNKTGVWGISSPYNDTTNWVSLAKTVTNGYILECDFVIYDVTTNLIMKRCDKRLNEVELYVGRNNSLTQFQWGNDRVTKNKVLTGSLMDIINSTLLFDSNELHEHSVLNSNSKSSSFELDHYTTSSISDNHITNLSQVTLIDFNSRFDGNFISKSDVAITFSTKTAFDPLKDCFFSYNRVNLSNVVIELVYNNYISYNNIDTGTLDLTFYASTCNFFKNSIKENGSCVLFGLTYDISNCSIEKGTMDINVPSKTYDGKKVSIGYSDFNEILDVSDLSIYDPVTYTLTIPTAMQKFVGVYSLLNSGSTLRVDKIIGLPTYFPTRIYGETNGDIVNFYAVPIIGAATNDIVTNKVFWKVIDPLATTELQVQINNDSVTQSYVVIEKKGVFNAITEINNFW